MKTLTLFLTGLCFFLLSSCEKEPVSIEGSPSTDSESVVDITDLISQLELKDTITLLMDVSESSLRIRTSLKDLPTKPKAYYQDYEKFIARRQKVRLNFSASSISSYGGYGIDVEAIRKYHSGGCGARYYTRVPEKVYAHKKYSYYRKVRNASEGPEVWSDICNPVNGSFHKDYYSSPRYKSTQIRKTDVSGYRYGGFTLYDGYWGNDTEVKIILYRGS